MGWSALPAVNWFSNLPLFGLTAQKCYHTIKAVADEALERLPPEFDRVIWLASAYAGNVRRYQEQAKPPNKRNPAFHV